MTTTDIPPITTALDRPPLRGPGSGRRIAMLIQQWSLVALLVLILLIATLTTPGFLSFDNLRGILINTAVIGIVAVALTPVTLSGNLVSLGIGQQAMLGAVTFLGLLASGMPIAIAIIITLLLLTAVGSAQGAFVSLGLNPMITTLAAGAIIFGLTTIATGGVIVVAPGVDFAWIALVSPLGLPLPVYIFIIITILASILVHATKWGRWMTLLGASRATARLSGISLRASTILAFAVLGLGAGVSGIVVAAQAGQATSQDLGTLTSNVIAAVLVGGTAIQGGFGSPLRSALGALMIAIFGNVLVLHDVSHGWRLTATGALVVVMVIVLHVVRRKANS